MIIEARNVGLAQGDSAVILFVEMRKELAGAHAPRACNRPERGR
jgi:hypothetical protein